MTNRNYRCETCYKFVSSSNYARHQRLHKIYTCRTCTSRMQRTKTNIDLAISWYFQSFQHDILSDEVLEKMKEVMKCWDLFFIRSKTETILRCYYTFALCQMEYLWLMEDQMQYDHIFNLIMNKIHVRTY